MASPFRLSVVIPTYNRRDMVVRAVASVLDQDGAESVQVIVADDGSTDGTAQAIHAQFRDDARVGIVHTQHRYASAARNAGFAATTGDFVCFLDSDDYWLPGTLAVFEAVFAANPSLAFVSVDGSTVDVPGQPAIARVVAGHAPGWSHAEFRRVALRTESLVSANGSVAVRRGDYVPAIVHGDLFYLSGLVARRSAIVGAGPFNERFRFFNDWEFFARLSLQGEGAYVDFNGFRRDTGRADQISRGRPMVAIARRRRFILRSLPRRFPERVAAYGRPLRIATSDAIYFMARCLVETKHRRWARRYLYRCLARGHKPLRSLALLAKSFTPHPLS